MKLRDVIDQVESLEALGADNQVKGTELLLLRKAAADAYDAMLSGYETVEGANQNGYAIRLNGSVAG